MAPPSGTAGKKRAAGATGDDIAARLEAHGALPEAAMHQRGGAAAAQRGAEPSLPPPPRASR